MTKKKILFFLPLPPPVHGAALRNQSLVDSKVLQNAFDIRVIPFNFATRVDDIGKASMLKLLKFGRRCIDIVSEMRSFKPELVYFNFSVYGTSLFRDFIFALLFKCFDTRIIYQLRTQGVNAQATSSSFKRWIFKTTFRNGHVMCISEFLATDVKSVYFRSPIIVNNGIKDEFVEMTERKSEGPPRLLFLSNLSESKGVLDFISALSILKKDGIQFRASLAGQPQDLTVNGIAEVIAREGLSSELTLLGPTYGLEKLKLFREADIFVFPTHFEAFPGVVLEAMQFKLPVVSTFEGAIPEIIDDGKTGFLVPKQSPVELEEKILQLILHPEMRMSLGSAGREKFLANYTLPLFEKRMKSAFDEVLGEQ